jgi:hypothetical protein
LGGEAFLPGPAVAWCEWKRRLVADFFAPPDAASSRARVEGLYLTSFKFEAQSGF